MPVTHHSIFLDKRSRTDWIQWNREMAVALIPGLLSFPIGMILFNLTYHLFNDLCH